MPYSDGIVFRSLFSGLDKKSPSWGLIISLWDERMGLKDPRKGFG